VQVATHRGATSSEAMGWEGGALQKGERRAGRIQDSAGQSKVRDESAWVSRQLRHGLSTPETDGES